MGLLDTFVNRVSIEPNGCRVWQGPLTRDGYGRSGNVSIHRRAYVLANGCIPTGLEVDHLCRNKACINPEHMEAVTHAENMRRKHELITHCPKGHEYTKENTYIRSTGCRKCRACNTERERTRRGAVE